ncbi:MAG: chromate resistance protein ChrB domain-containing protein [Gemmatimonadaceae bacterium]
MPDSSRWLLLLHQLPPKPDYLRVKIRRRLAGLGAALVKNSVYVLPNTPESLEDFQWLRQEIEAANGSALIAEAAFVEGISDEEIEGMLIAERVDIPDEGRAATEEPDRVGSARVWVTRQGVFVDRIASAWLIRRFIDKRARFKFINAQHYRPQKDELRFDMVGAEYTHVGEDCSFQTLLRRFGLDDRGLRAIGEVVHDIDCKDERYGRPETAGVFGLLRGIAASNDDDMARIERGSPLFDDLYAFYSTQRSAR